MTVSAADSIWVVLPTYNERDNLPALAATLLKDPRLHILVVDDHSPDGTGAIADAWHRQQPRLTVLHRPGKGGLASAYQQGFRQVLARGATTVIQMDADFSHDPKLIPVILDTLRQADVVLGSRYVSGGSMNIDLSRRWISRLGNGYIRFMLGREIKDWSTGYKAWRASFLSQVLTQPTHGIGYAWLMEMNWLARQLGGRVREVPLVFQERRAGRSKFNWSIVWEDVWLAWQLRWRRAFDVGVAKDRKK